MNILFSADVKNTAQDSATKAVLEMINSPQNKLVVFFKKNKYSNILPKKYQSIHELKQLLNSKYDLILAYNKNGLEQIKDFAAKSGTPVIYMVNASDIDQEYPKEINSLSRIILLNPSSNFPKVFVYKSMLIPFQLPVKLNEATECKMQNREKPKLLVCIENKNLKYSPLYQLIPLLNTLTGFETKIINNGEPFKSMVNTNIDVVDEHEGMIENEILESDIVIGSGQGIRMAIALSRPCIIAGERGGGGLVTPKNFSRQYRAGFHGRMGGYLDEHIPLKLLREHIKDIKEMGTVEMNRLLEENRKLIDEEYTIARKQLTNLLERTAQGHIAIKQNQERQQLWFNNALEFTPLKEEGQFALVDKISKKVYCGFEEEETDIIKLFEKGCIVNKAMVASGYEQEPHSFYEFVQELVNDKILVTDES